MAAATLVEKKRKEDIRLANIRSARAVAEAVGKSLGPKGMDKRISTATGDGVTKTEVLQPAAKMLVEPSKSQDSVNVIAGLLVKQIQTLLMRGIQPSVISDALHKAAAKTVDMLIAATDRESEGGYADFGDGQG